MGGDGGGLFGESTGGSAAECGGGVAAFEWGWSQSREGTGGAKTEDGAAVVGERRP